MIFKFTQSVERGPGFRKVNDVNDVKFRFSLCSISTEDLVSEGILFVFLFKRTA